MSLHLGIYESATGQLWRSLGHIARGLKFSANRHGFLALECEAPMSLIESFMVFDRPGLPHVEANWSGFVAWAGRLEDVGAISGGANIGALGYQRALRDVPYTSLWSTTRVADWMIADERNQSNRRPKMYLFDTNNRLSIELTKGTVYDNSADAGTLFWMAPSGSDKNVVAFSFDYNYTLPTNWILRIQRITVAGDVSDGAFTPTTLEDITGDGANHTGSKSYTFAADDGVQVVIFNNTGSSYTVTAENGAWFARLTNIRVKGTTTATVKSDEIATALLAYVNSINPGQISTSAALIESTGLDLTDEVYEDMLPGDILEYLVTRGDNQTPPRRWEWAIWEQQLLALRPRASQAQEWYFDLSRPDLERTLDLMHNSAYGVYQEASGRALRTAVSSDAYSVSRYAITRRQAVPASTTSATQAATERDAFINHNKDPLPRAGVMIRELYDNLGNPWPLYFLRPGHILTARNLVATMGASVDRVRSFVVDETEYDQEAGQLKAVPEAPLATLDTVVVESAFKQQELIDVEYGGKKR